MKCAKCLMFTNSNDIKIKLEIDGKISLSSYVLIVVFKNLQAIEEKELSDLSKIIIYIQNNVIVLFELGGFLFCSNQISYMLMLWNLEKYKNKRQKSVIGC